MKTWNTEETTILKQYYNRVPNIELYKLIPNKSPIAIYKKAKSLGLMKNKDIAFLNRSNARKGEKCCNWKGGKYKTPKGYIEIKKPEYPKANNRGYVLEHIFVFEEKTGLIVPDNCCIHHLNGNKSDNRIENLCLMLTTAHTTYHNIERCKAKERKHE